MLTQVALILFLQFISSQRFKVLDLANTIHLQQKKLVNSTVILGWVDALVIWLGGKLLVAIQKKDSWSFQS